MMEVKNSDKESMYPGQDLIVAGFIGDKGVNMIALEKEEELLHVFSKSYIVSIQSQKEIPLTINFDFLNEIGVTAWELVKEGGIFTALWNLSGRFNTGIEFQIRKIPIRQSCVEVCEKFKLNPYRLLTENCIVMAADHGYQVIQSFEKLGVACAVIGKVNKGIKREIYHGEERGFLDRPQKDELKKVIPSYFMRHNN